MLVEEDGPEELLYMVISEVESKGKDRESDAKFDDSERSKDSS